MDEIFNSASLQPIKRRTGMRLRRCAQSGAQAKIPLTEQDCRDVMAREVFEARNLADDLRFQVLRQLVQVSPGGVLASAWLCVNDGAKVGLDKLREFALQLIDPQTVKNLTRDASREPLAKVQALYAFSALISHPDFSRLDRLCMTVCLLLSDCFSEEARSAMLERTLELRVFNSADRRILCQWGMGLDVEDEISKGFLREMPLPPTFLARKAITCLVRVGEDATKVVRHILDNIECWADTKPLLQGVLDIIEFTSQRGEAQTLPRQRIYELCIANPEASLRRRAYVLASATEGDELMRRALHDKDLGVRNWAMAYFNGRGR